MGLFGNIGQTTSYEDRRERESVCVCVTWQPRSFVLFFSSVCLSLFLPRKGDLPWPIEPALFVKPLSF